MLKNFLIIIILGSFCCFLYGILNIYVEVEQNACRMTYMFGQPQFLRVQLKDKKFPNYGLYYYYEGNHEKDIASLDLSGAPVIFIPGNGGSHKQVRSLASVALKKAMDSKIHLDYFTIDYNEELSALYGGYLENQKNFLKICINSVIKFYKETSNVSRSIVLIGHSMGGKVAQAILMDDDVSAFINTIIFIASPLDNPVVNPDLKIDSFYEKTNTFLNKTRTIRVVDNETNFCCDHRTKLSNSQYENTSALLNNVLLISIGGGNRDLLVRPGLTTSKYSDIHAMTSSIPKVWLSCDHLSSVWCLQLVLVINRFLFSISYQERSGAVSFIEEKSQRLQTANNFFVKPIVRPRTLESEFNKKWIENTWHEESKRVFKKQFKNGLKQNYNQMIQLRKYEQFKKIYIEVINLDHNDWIFGCDGKQLSTGNHICNKGTSLSHLVQNVPSKGLERSMVFLDLHNIRKTYTNWTHLLIHLGATKKPIFFNVDIYDPSERYFHVKAPRWFEINKKYVLNETVQGTVYHKMLIKDLDDSFHGMKVNIKPIACVGTSYHVRTKLCVPWISGFNRYHIITENSSSTELFVNNPASVTKGYNTTLNPVILEIYLDPACRFSISHQLSIENSMSRMVQEFYHWLPSHLCAVLFMVLKAQLSKFYTQDSFKYYKPYTGFFQSKSLFIITGCRIFKKFLLPFNLLSKEDFIGSSFYVSVIIHNIAIVISILFSFAIWGLLLLNGNVIQRIAARLTKFSFATTSILVSICSKLPMSFGVLSISIAMRSCSGIALLLACIFYFIVISNSYKDYLESLLWKSATNIFNGTSKTKPQLNGNISQTDKTSENSANYVIEKSKAEARCEGLLNFPFHITLFLLLFVFTLLNSGVTLAWVKNYRNGNSLHDPCVEPTMVVLGCLSIILQLNAPKKFSVFRFGYRIVSIMLYMCATACIIYCQEAIYRLNFIIAFVFVVILAVECIGRFCELFAKESGTGTK